jgi:glycosyltransferase involved in cell wall biosynthesis
MASGMKLLVYPHIMEIGGSQLNAIELARGVQEQGHDVVVFAPDGELVPMVEQFGLEYIRSPDENKRPSLRNIRELNHIVAARGIDIVHGYEDGPALELALGPHRKFGTPLVTTVLSMSVPSHIPTHERLIVGTADLLEAQTGIRNRSYLIEPPIDTDANSPTVAGGGRALFGIDQDTVLIAVICRMTTDLDKLQGVLEAIGVVGRLAESHPVALLVVGAGSGLPQVREAATAVNDQFGRDVIVVTGALLDPRPAYAAADIVIGMGSSALKGMAFGKPLVVQGEQGFWKLLEPATLPIFLAQGFFGHGGTPDDLRGALTRLISNPAWRVELGRFARRVVVDRFSLSHAIGVQCAIYRDAIDIRPSRQEIGIGLGRMSVELAKFKFSMARQRARRHLQVSAKRLGTRTERTQQ